MVVDIIISRENNAKVMYEKDGDNEKGVVTSPTSSFNGNNDNNIYSEEEEGDGRFQEAAERLAVEAYVRGSTDNIGVCVVAVD